MVLLKYSIGPWPNSWPYSQQDWDTYLLFIFMAYKSAVQDFSMCTPALLVLRCELQNPPELLFGKLPDMTAVPARPEYARLVCDRRGTMISGAREGNFKWVSQFGCSRGYRCLIKVGR